MPRQTASKRQARRRPYHHGDLRAALIEATLQLVAESGPEQASVREAAKRAGVSPGAPFRHFPNRTALLTAVAEEAMRRLTAEITSALEARPSDDPVSRFRALALGYLRWVVRNPTYVRVISSRALIDFEGSRSLRRDNDELRDLMAGLLSEAQRRGLMPTADVRLVVLEARALGYGLARMYVDGQFPSWDVAEDDAERTMTAIVDQFIDRLRTR
jgi:AcrR family transcriptional regulator